MKDFQTEDALPGYSRMLFCNMSRTLALGREADIFTESASEGFLKIRN